MSPLRKGGSGANINFRIEGEFDRIPAPKERCLYRVTQEALNNIVRHANASQASVLLTHEGGQYRLLVQDKGKGFDVASIDPGQHFGLSGMAERARFAGGSLEIRSKKNDTRVELVLPEDESITRNGNG
ncbi:MAG: hypothetical protein HN855_00195 [Anaerolineae bacterium]|jgi:signal transduction histidine kinase|nr:hypothetical protein [Anaerolineae bacterium]